MMILPLSMSELRSSGNRGVAYGRLWAALRGNLGGDVATALEACRRYVAGGLESFTENPFASSGHGWLLRSHEFEARPKSAPPTAPNRRSTRHARALLTGRPELTWTAVLGAVSALDALSPADLSRRRQARDASSGRGLATAEATA
jgi:hypothetical protein